MFRSTINYRHAEENIDYLPAVGSLIFDLVKFGSRILFRAC